MQYKLHLRIVLLCVFRDSKDKTASLPISVAHDVKNRKAQRSVR